MYNSTHYGMGSMTVTLTWRPPKPTRTMTPKLVIMATNSTDSKVIGDLGGGYQLMYKAPG
jgi:hypothetical protein